MRRPFGPLLAGAGLVYLAAYLLVALSRIAYPYELEWMEGGAVDHVRRVIEGQPLYVPPSIEFTPYVYTPVYFYVSAAVARLTGVGFLPLRLVSLLSSLGCFALIFLIVRRETKDRLCAFLASSMFAGTFRLGGAWFDLARVDMLFLLLLLAGVYALRASRSVPAGIAAGLLFSLSFLTKQSALIVAVALAVHCFAGRGSFWSRMTFPAVFATTTAAGALLLDRGSAGWFSYYVFALPRHHALETSRILGFWSEDLARPFGVALALAVAAIWLARQRDRTEVTFLLCLFAGMVGVAWFSRAHSGGFDNVLMPAHAALAIFFGLGLHALGPHLDELRRRRLDLPIYAACFIQFLSLAYNPFELIPARADEEAGRELIELMTKIKGDVYMPSHGYLPVLAGKRSYAQIVALDDVLRSGDQLRTREIDEELKTAFRDGRFGGLILDFTTWSYEEEIRARYDYKGAIFTREDTFMPRTGVMTRPQYLYLLRP